MGTVHNLREAAYPPVDHGGGGPHDPGMEARIAKLEVAADYIQRDVRDLREDVRAIRTDVASIRTTDFRLMYAAIIFVALGLAGIMAHGFKWI